MKPTTRGALALASTLFLLTVGACGAGSRSGSDGGSVASGSVSGRSADRATGGETTTTSPPGQGMTTAKPAALVGPIERAVVSTGQLDLRASDLPAARTRILDLVAGWGGIVADEQSSGDRKGRITGSTLALRVPTARFDQAMTELGKVGTLQRQSRSSKDVTTEVIDVTARVRAAKRSIRSLETLLSRAAKLGDVIAIENNLAERQANLDSLEQQQAYLADQTSLSTITVRLSLPPSQAHPRKADEQGFLAGLGRGWHALGATLAVLATVLGAALPFALVLVVVGVPVWLAVRRRRPVAGPPAGEAG